MGRTLYSIRDWDIHFEKAQSRKIDGALAWVALPTKHDGLGFRRIIAEDPVIYAAWVILVQVAAKCPKRGVLADENGPLDESDLETKTGLSKETFARALKFLSSSRVGWISRRSLVDDYQTNGSELPPQERTEQNNTEHTSPNGEVSSEPPAAPGNSEQPILTFPCAGMRGGSVWHLYPSKLSEYQESYPGIDALAECRKALQWCRDNPAKRKTPKGMLAFLNRWIQNAQNDYGGRDPPRRKPARGVDISDIPI